MPEAPDALRKLAADGLIQRRGAEWRTTARFQGAMARAALRLLRCAVPQPEDLRVPLSAALLELYGPELEDAALAELVAVLLPIEARELAPG